jgi:hypothetical protein
MKKNNVELEENDNLRRYEKQRTTGKIEKKRRNLKKI